MLNQIDLELNNHALDLKSLIHCSKQGVQRIKNDVIAYNGYSIVFALNDVKSPLNLIKVQLSNLKSTSGTPMCWSDK